MSMVETEIDQICGHLFWLIHRFTTKVSLLALFGLEWWHGLISARFSEWKP